MKDVELMRFNESWNLMSLIQFKRYISEFWCILVPFVATCMIRVQFMTYKNQNQVAKAVPARSVSAGP